MSLRSDANGIYQFVFKDDSIWSWLVNLILAFIIVKFVIYPLLSLVLGTSLPLVAVISGSMEHESLDFDSWWEQNKAFYEEQGINKDLFQEYRFPNGFDTGDVMVLHRAEPLELGDVLVYHSPQQSYPIIHRVIYINDEGLIYHAKGDNNNAQDPVDITSDAFVGKALYRIPKIGWLKIWAVQLLN